MKSHLWSVALALTITSGTAAQHFHGREDVVSGNFAAHAVKAAVARDDAAKLFAEAHDGYSLILGDFGSWADALALATEINTRGGRIDLVINQRFLIGVVPAEIEQRVRAWTGVRFLTRKPTPVVQVPGTRDATVNGIVGYYNRVVDGTRLREILEAPQSDPLPAETPLKDSELPPSEQPDRSTGADETTGSRRPRNVATNAYHNEYLYGSIGVNVFFTESNGSIDANYYTWTLSDVNSTSLRMLDGLDWWHTRAFARGLSFVSAVAFHSPVNEPQVFQGYEPIRNPIGDRGKWVSAIMGNYGYTQTENQITVQAIARNRAYNEAFRTAIGGTSSHSVFVAYNPAGTNVPDRYTGNAIALAYIGGPYIEIAFRPANLISKWAWIYSHEMGHIYWACDEFFSQCAGCGTCAPNGPRPAVSNGNCEDGCAVTPVSCMMLNAITATGTPPSGVCSYTAQQIGW